MTAIDEQGVFRSGRHAGGVRRAAAFALVVASVCAAVALLGDVPTPIAVLAFIVLTGAGVVLLSNPAPDPRSEIAAPTATEAPALAARAADLVGALPDPCIVVDKQGNVLLHNERAREALPGLRNGNPLTFILRAPEVTEALSAVMRDGRAVTVTYQERVPIERVFEAHMHPICANPGRDTPNVVVITLHDQTNQQRLERMRVDFVANASHELRTPLASLSGFIETLQGPARNDPAARERFLEIMRGQAVRMSRLIDDLLSLSRIELNAHVLPEAVVDLRSIVAQTADALAPLAEESRVQLDLALGEVAVDVRGDRDELYRVCENLIENAIKYGADGEWVGVSLGHVPAEDGLPAAVALTVRDRGPGIAEEHLPRLTERFYRVDTVTSREKGGTGLGLAIVKHIVARHRGRLLIESRVGEGTSFIVRLPQWDAR